MSSWVFLWDNESWRLWRQDIWLWSWEIAKLKCHNECFRIICTAMHVDNRVGCQWKATLMFGVLWAMYWSIDGRGRQIYTIACMYTWPRAVWLRMHRWNHWDLCSWLESLWLIGNISIYIMSLNFENTQSSMNQNDFKHNILFGRDRIKSITNHFLYLSTKLEVQATIFNVKVNGAWRRTVNTYYYIQNMV